MDSPFLYNKYVTGQHFIGRKEDCAILANLLSQGENVVLWEPVGTGKKSIVHQVLTKMKVSGARFVTGEITALDIRSNEALARRLGSAVIRLVASTPDEYAQVVSKYLSGTHFIFDPAAYSSSDAILSTNWEINDTDIKEVLRLPYRLAEDRHEKFFLIIDEFQNLDLTDDGEKLFKLMEEVIDEGRQAGNKNFSYIFLGSMYNAMRDIFVRRHFFYRRVEHFSLSKVDEREIVEHNLFYINHFTSICDSLSKGYIMEPVLLEALDTIISIHRGRFIATMNDLTTFQVSLLKAIIDGYTKFSTAEVIRKYSLNSSANVRRLKDALMKKEILTFVGDDERPVIFDPLFEYWLKNTYFKNN